MLINDLSQGGTKPMEAKFTSLVTVVASLMVMAMKGVSDTKGPTKFVDGLETMRMSRGSLMGHQNVRVLPLQAHEVRRKDRAAMFARQATSPPIALAASIQEGLRCLVNRLLRRHPHLLTKHAAKASHAQSVNGHHPAVQIAVSHARREKVIVVSHGVSVVVPVNEPHLCQITNRHQHLIQRLRGLDVAQENNGIGAMRLHSANHMIELTMGVAAEKDHWSRFRLGNAARKSANCVGARFGFAELRGVSMRIAMSSSMPGNFLSASASKEVFPCSISAR